MPEQHTTQQPNTLFLTVQFFAQLAAVTGAATFALGNAQDKTWQGNDIKTGMIVGTSVAALSAFAQLLAPYYSRAQLSEKQHFGMHLLSGVAMIAALTAMSWNTVKTYDATQPVDRIVLPAVALFDISVGSNVLYTLGRFLNVIKQAKPAAEFLMTLPGYTGSVLFLIAQLMNLEAAKKSGDRAAQDSAILLIITSAGFIFNMGFNAVRAGVAATQNCRWIKNTAEQQPLLDPQDPRTVGVDGSLNDPSAARLVSTQSL